MLKNITMKSAAELDSAKKDIQGYFSNFGAVKSVSIGKGSDDHPDLIVSIEFNEVESAVIAKGYAEGEKYFDNIIDLAFVHNK
jgi:hypothetical protein